MKLCIKQRVFSWSDTYDIYDENGNTRYFVKAEIFSFGHQIHVYEKQTGDEVGAVYEKMFCLLPRFELKIDSHIVGTVQKKFSLFRPQYEVDCKGWRVEGDFLGWNYDVMSGCCAAMHIRKELWSWGDTYTLDFENPADELIGLLLVIAIDAANCDNC